MLAYPGYTVRSIRRELSMRRLRELIDCCQTDPPAAMQAAKLNFILCKLLGIEDQDMPQADTTQSKDRDTEIRSQLAGMGELFKVTFEG